MTSRESRNRGQSGGWERPGEKPRVSERPAPEVFPAIAISSRRRSRDERPLSRSRVEERLPLSETLNNIGNQEGEGDRSKREANYKGAGC